MQIGETARCFATVLVMSLPLSLALFAMLRHGAPLREGTEALTGSLAVAAMSATAMSVFHSLDASAMILIWNLGTAGVIVVLGGSLGQKSLSARP